jgi:hypothetical protein
MVGVSDIVALLELWPGWKRVRDAPARVDALEERLAAVEWLASVPADARCQRCWKGIMCVTHDTPDALLGAAGAVRRHRKCDAPGCGFEDFVMR